MPLEVECHKVPHLKGLTLGIEYMRMGVVHLYKAPNQFEKYSFCLINRSNGSFI